MKTVENTMKRALYILAISMFCIGLSSCSDEIVDPEEEEEDLMLEEDDVPLFAENTTSVEFTLA